MLPCIANVKRLIERLAAGGFARHVATLASGAALAQLLPLLFAPLLTRLYSPADFGVLAVFVAWLSNLAVISTGRYDMAVVLPKTEPEAARLMLLSLCINTVLLVLCLLLFWPWHDDIATLLKAPALASWLPLLPLGVWLAGGVAAWTAWNNRQRRYAANAQGRVVQSLGVSLLQVAAGWSGLAAGGLIVSQLIGQALALLTLARADIAARFAFLRGHSRPEVLAEARRYREFPLVNTPHAFVVALQDSLMLALLASLSGAAIVGQYALVLRVLKLPAAMVGQAVSQVVFRDLAEAAGDGRVLSGMLKRALLMLAALAVVPFSLLALWGGPLFALVFGEPWRGAGEIAALLTPYFAAAFVAGPAFMVPMVINRQRASFVFVLIGVIVNLAVFAAVYLASREAMLALAVMSGVMTIYFAAYVAWVFRLLRPREIKHV